MGEIVTKTHMFSRGPLRYRLREEHKKKKNHTSRPAPTERPRMPKAERSASAAGAETQVETRFDGVTGFTARAAEKDRDSGGGRQGGRHERSQAYAAQHAHTHTTLHAANIMHMGVHTRTCTLAQSGAQNVCMRCMCMCFFYVVELSLSQTRNTAPRPARGAGHSQRDSRREREGSSLIAYRQTCVYSLGMRSALRCER